MRIVDSLGTGLSADHRRENLSSSRRSDQSSAPLSILYNGYTRVLPRHKAAGQEAYHSNPSLVELKN